MRGSFTPKRRFWLLVAFVVAITVMSLAARPLVEWISARGAAAVPGRADAAEGAATQAQAVRLLAQGFGQREERAGYAFLVQNPDSQRALQGSEYRVTAFDAAAAAVGTDSGPITLLLPGETQGVAGVLIADRGARIARIQVELKTGEAVPVERGRAFTADMVQVHPSSAAVSGVVNNPYDRVITDLRVSAVAYDSAGAIVGGGVTYLPFIAAAGKSGVVSSLVGDKPVARADIAPALSEQSQVTAPGEGLPLGAREPALLKCGFGQIGREFGYGVLVQNPNVSFGVQQMHYHVTAYGDGDRVLAADDGIAEVLLATETLGVGGALSLDGDERVARVEVQLLAGKFTMSPAPPRFRAEDVAYVADEGHPHVTGRIVNPYGDDANTLLVSAIAYDAADAIIGGGYAFLDFVAAGGKSDVEVPLVTPPPARVELYATRSALTKMK